jgi:hypothetical protein
MVVDNTSHLKNVVGFTIDVDWAPDFVVKYCVDWFVKHELPVTLFYTHKSTFALNILSQSKFVDIGIHPDFSRAEDYNKCVKDLLDIYPNSLISRSHRNMDGRPVTNALLNNGVKYHSNKILFGQPDLRVLKVYNGMYELPYFWEDGYHLELGCKLDVSDLYLPDNGTLIFNLHPILFYLNLEDDEVRKKATYGVNNLTLIEKTYLDVFINNEYGIGSFTKDLLIHLKTKKYNIQRLIKIFENNEIT